MAHNKSTNHKANPGGILKTGAWLLVVAPVSLTVIALTAFVFDQLLGLLFVYGVVIGGAAVLFFSFLIMRGTQWRPGFNHA